MDRLQKIMAQAGLASRREAEVMIAEGRVMLNGTIVTEVGTKADLAVDSIKVDGKRIKRPARMVYILLNKPKHTITSRRDPEGRKTVMDLITDVKERISPVGRLDYDTEGLLILTNDGNLANALMHPRNEVEKTYWVKIKGHLSEETLKKIAAGGISLRTGKTAPCRIRALHDTEQNGWVEIILHEGKKREIRRLMEKMRHPVIKLKRVAYAFLTEKGLALGKYRYLTSYEVKKLESVAYKQTFEPPIKKESVSSRSKTRSVKRRTSPSGTKRLRTKS